MKYTPVPSGPLSLALAPVDHTQKGYLVYILDTIVSPNPVFFGSYRNFRQANRASVRFPLGATPEGIVTYSTAAGWLLCTR